MAATFDLGRRALAELLGLVVVGWRRDGCERGTRADEKGGREGEEETSKEREENGEEGEGVCRPEECERGHSLSEETFREDAEG